MGWVALYKTFTTNFLWKTCFLKYYFPPTFMFCQQFVLIIVYNNVLYHGHGGRNYTVFTSVQLQLYKQRLESAQQLTICIVNWGRCARHLEKQICELFQSERVKLLYQLLSTIINSCSQKPGTSPTLNVYRWHANHLINPICGLVIRI